MAMRRHSGNVRGVKLMAATTTATPGTQGFIVETDQTKSHFCVSINQIMTLVQIAFV